MKTSEMASGYTLLKTILITGASSGIGAQLALAYAEPGVTLMLTGQNTARLGDIQRQCHERGAEILAKPLDIRDGDAVAAWISEMDAAHPIDLVIANAGVSSAIGPGGEAETWDGIKDCMDVNLMGVLHAITPLVEPMRRRGRGQIALMSSLGGYRGMPQSPAYSASKAAVKTYGEALRGWLKPDGVSVTVICPGYVKSPMSDRLEGPKPFLVAPERAAAIIRNGIANKKAVLSFPFPLNLGTWLLSILPSWLADFILIKGFNFSVRPRNE